MYERSLEELEEYAQDEELFIRFAEFEIRSREHERARVIYKYALERLDKDLAQELYKRDVENVIIDKRRVQYEDAIKSSVHNYDVWFDYIRLEEVINNCDSFDC